MGELFYLKDGSLVNVSRGTKGDKGDQGDTGPQGPQGVPGPVGPLDTLSDVSVANPADRQFLSWDEPTQQWIARTSVSSLGIVAFQYTFGVATDATPNAGYVHANANPVGGATMLYINKENRAGEDITLFLENITAGCWINMFDYDQSERFVAYDVAGSPTQVGDVFHIPVTLFDGAGPELTNNTRVSLFIRYVTQGGAGSDGYTYMQDTTPGDAADRPVDGQTWFDTSTGYTFVYYEDADSGQWVMDNGGGSGGGGGFDGEHVLTGDPNDPPAELQVGQLLWDGDSYGSGAPGEVVYIDSALYRVLDTYTDTQTDIALDAGGVFPFDTIAEFTLSGIMQKPDRGGSYYCFLWCSLPGPTQGWTNLAYSPLVTTTGAGWVEHGDLVVSLPVPAGSAGVGVVLRFITVPGGATLWSYSYQMTRKRYRA